MRIDTVAARATRLLQGDLSMLGAGVALGLLLGLLGSLGRGWAAPVVVVAVVAVSAYYMRALGLAAGLVVALIVTNALDHFTFPVGGLDMRAEQVAAAVGLVVLTWQASRARAVFSLLRPSTAEWLLAAWLGVGLVSSIAASPSRLLSLKVLALTAICTVGFLLPRRLLSGSHAREDLERVLRWLLIIFATESAYGTFAYLLHVFGPTISIGPNPATGHLGAYGTLWEQNVFGTFAAAGGVAWVYLGPERFKRAWVGLALCVGGLVDSLTRAAWLAAAIAGMVGIGVPGLRRRLNMPMVGTGLLGGMLLAVAALVVDAFGAYTVAVVGAPPSQQHSFLFAIFNMTDFIGRLNQTGPVWSEIHGQYLLLGRGTASYEALHVVNGVPEHIASLPLLVLNDTGLIGITLFSAFLAAVVARAWSRRHDKPTFALGQIVLVMFIGNLATQTTELMVTWLLAGLLVAATDIASNPEKVQPRGGQPSTPELGIPLVNR